MQAHVPVVQHWLVESLNQGLKPPVQSMIILTSIIYASPQLLRFQEMNNTTSLDAGRIINGL